MSLTTSRYIGLIMLAGVIGLIILVGWYDNSFRDDKTPLENLPKAAKESVQKIAGGNKVLEHNVEMEDDVNVEDDQGEVGDAEDEDLDGDELQDEVGEVTEFHVEEISPQELPDAVKDTINREIGDEESYEPVRYQGEDQEYFELDVESGAGAETVYLISADGNLANKMQVSEIDYEAVPEAVKSGVLKILRQDDIKDIEEVVSIDGTYYDFEFLQGDSEIKIRLDASGNPLAKFIEKADADEDDEEDNQ